MKSENVEKKFCSKFIIRGRKKECDVKENKMKKKKRTKMKFGALTVMVEKVEHDLTGEFGVDTLAAEVMKDLEGKVSDDLLELLNVMLLGFCDEMQLEIADDLVDFACDRMVHTTNCPSADAVLLSCYEWIAKEKVKK